MRVPALEKEDNFSMSIGYVQTSIFRVIFMFWLRTLRQLRPLIMSSCNRSQFSLPSALSPKDRLIWVDCEMTGLDLERDKLLEIAVIVTEGDTLATVARTESLIIHCDDQSLDSMNEWCVRQHGVSGLTQVLIQSPSNPCIICPTKGECK